MTAQCRANSCRCPGRMVALDDSIRVRSICERTCPNFSLSLFHASFFSLKNSLSDRWNVDGVSMASPLVCSSYLTVGRPSDTSRRRSQMPYFECELIKTFSLGTRRYVLKKLAKCQMNKICLRTYLGLGKISNSHFPLISSFD